MHVEQLTFGTANRTKKNSDVEDLYLRLTHVSFLDSFFDFRFFSYEIKSLKIILTEIMIQF